MAPARHYRSSDVCVTEAFLAPLSLGPAGLENFLFRRPRVLPWPGKRVFLFFALFLIPANPLRSANDQLNPGTTPPQKESRKNVAAVTSAPGKIGPPASTATSPFPASTFSKGPEGAPVTVVEFTDFECAPCERSVSLMDDLLKAYPGKIRLVFKNDPLHIHVQSRLAHEAALAAAAQGKFWEMHDLLFLHQTNLGFDDLVSYAKQLGLNVETFTRALNNHTYADLVDHDVSEAQGLGVTGTPTFLINGRKLVGVHNLASFTAIVDQELSPAPGAHAEGGPTPDPNRVNLTSAPVRGPPNAPVTIVEFSDFQCPFCAGSVPILKQLLKNYPDQVRLVFKSFPLDFHADAMLAHQAALAANQQNKFWEMYDRIYGSQRAMKRGNLINMAQDLGLDVDRFTADMDNPQFRSVIEADRKEGARLGVEATPSFFINGKLVVGAQSLAVFTRLIEESLHSSGTANQGGASISGNRVISPGAGERAEVDIARGPADAPVKILWYSDLQSPLAPGAAQLVEQVMAAFPGKIRLEYKNFPLPFHPNAPLVHEAALAAGAQGKFWEMQDLILQHQSALKQEDLIRYAAQIGLDNDKFTKALTARTYRTQVEGDVVEGEVQNVRGAPVFFINGTRVDGVQPWTVFKQIIDKEVATENVANH
jgi:protein-disulfide isomerase